MPPPADLIALAWLTVGVAHAQGRADPRDDALRQLQKQLADQQALIEAQQRQIDRLIEKVEGRPAPAVPTAEAVAAAMRDEARPEPWVGTRYDGIKLTLGGALRTTLMYSSARAQPDGSPFFLLPEFPGMQQGGTKLDARPRNVMLGIEGARPGNYQLGGLFVFALNNGDLFSGGSSACRARCTRAARLATISAPSSRPSTSTAAQSRRFWHRQAVLFGSIVGGVLAQPDGVSQPDLGEQVLADRGRGHLAADRLCRPSRQPGFRADVGDRVALLIHRYLPRR